MPEPHRVGRFAWLTGLIVCCTATAQAEECEQLASIALDHTQVLSASLVAPGAFEPPGGARFGRQAYAGLPEFCRLEAVARPARGSEIGIEVWLPATDWNDKLVGVGNGAWAGSISYSAMAEALAAGYAATSTDTGHRGGSADFALENEDKLIDFAYRAVHEMTLTAKVLVDAYYGRAEQRSYFSGCSTGGRQALTAAQRFPGDFDGIIAGAPAYYPSHIQGMQVFTAAVANRSAAAMLTREEHALLNSAAIAACDRIDGVADGVIEDPRQCGFDPGVLACPAADGGTCLSPAQVDTARRIYQGPTTAAGESIYPGLSRGSEAGWTTLAGAEPLSLAYETFALLVYGDRDWDWRSFDAETDIANAVREIGPLMDANDANIDAFVAHGGKLLLYHGWADPGIPAAGTVRYYDEVRAALGERRSEDSVRLFMVPGMGHCAGGTGTDRFDALAALDGWLDSGSAPDRIEAERVVDGDVVRSRPLCAYPETAVYDGTGSTDESTSFRCE
jgi:feruloyl esterase